MPRTSFRAINIIDIISKGAIYLLVFLMPIFFLPWTANALDFNKQVLMIALVFISLFAWMIKTLIVGKITLNVNIFHILVFVFVLVFLFSTIFSAWKFGSFWGWPQITTESMLTIIGLLMLYLLVSNMFSKKEVLCSLVILFVSGLVAMIFGGLQLWGKFLLPLDFTKIPSYNTIGGAGNLAMFAASLLPIIICFLIGGKKIIRIFSVIAGLVCIVLLFSVALPTAWWVVATGSAIIMIFGMLRRDFFDNRWMILPMFFLAIAIFCGLFRIQITGLPQRPIEVSLNQRASFAIAWQTIKENPVLGSGPGTFIYNFARYKDSSFNQTTLWNARFNTGISRIISLLADIGILGLLSFSALMGGVIFYGARFFLKGAKALAKDEQTDEKFVWAAILGIFASFVAISVSYFMDYSGLALDFVYFFLAAGFLAITAANRKEFVLKPSSLFTLGVTFAFTLIFIFGLGLFILTGQRYAAEVSYFKGLNYASQGKTDEAINYLTKAAGLNQNSDIYWSSLSQAYVQKMTKIISDKNLSNDQVSQQAQAAINNAVNAAKIATDVNPASVVDWSNRGDIYQSLIGIVPGAKDWAIKSYDQALVLEPLSPYFPTQEGIAMIREANFLSEDKAQDKATLLAEARAQFDKAVAVKSDYAPARYQIAMVYQAEGKTDEAVNALEETKQYAPFDVGLAFQLGLLYYQDKNYNKAQTELERALSIDPSYANAIYFLGLTYDAKGDSDKAIAEFQRVAALNPDNIEIRKIISNLRSGKSALEGIAEENPPTAPIEEKPE